MALNLTVSNPAAWAEAGYEYELIIPGTDEGTGAFITVRGSESKIATAFLHKKSIEWQRNELARARNKANAVKNPEENIEELVEFAISRIKSWRGIEEDGEAIPFTPENARRILTEHPWIRDSVLEASNTLENFRPK